MVITNEINCSSDAFWSSFLDTGFNEKLYREELRYSEFAVLERTERDNGTIFRRIAAKPPWGLPSPVAKVFQNDPSYNEEGSFNGTTRIWTWKRIFKKIPDKIRFEGSVRVEPVSDNKIRRIAEIIVESKIFNVGGLCDSFFEKSLREEADRSSRYFSKVLGS